MSAEYHIVIEPDVAEGWICYNTESAEDVRNAVASGGWEMDPEDALRIFGRENLPLVCPVNAKVSRDGKTVSFTPPAKEDLERDAADAARARRERLLAQTDYLAMPDYPLTDEQRKAVAAYRQALRDITEQEGWPRKVVWPEKPVI